MVPCCPQRGMNRRWSCGNADARARHNQGDDPVMNSIDTNKVPEDPTIRKEWIKFQLAVRGYSLAALAREHGVTRQQPQAALTRPYPKWERIIAEHLGMTPQQIWPERYQQKTE